MKKIILALALVFTICSANAQLILDKDIPQPVKTELKTRYPAATGTMWKQDLPGFVTAEFMQDKKRMNVVFSTSGGWVSTASYSKKDEYPAEVMAYINSNYSGAKIVTCALAESVKEKTYETRIRYNGESFDIILNSDFSFKLKSKVED